MNTVLVTVGSTSFQPLTDGIVAPAVLARLEELGVRRLVVQHGSARMAIPNRCGIEVVPIQYTASPGEMDALVAQADGVISHAGGWDRTERR